MDNLQDIHIAGRDYSGMAIAIIILAGIHVILSLVFSVMSYRKGLRKEGGAWLLSFGVCVAILVLAAVATGQKDNYTAPKPCPGVPCCGTRPDDFPMCLELVDDEECAQSPTLSPSGGCKYGASSLVNDMAEYNTWLEKQKFPGPGQMCCDTAPPGAAS